jgi:hypothetical protein
MRVSNFAGSLTTRSTYLPVLNPAAYNQSFQSSTSSSVGPNTFCSNTTGHEGVITPTIIEINDTGQVSPWNRAVSGAMQSLAGVATLLVATFGAKHFIRSDKPLLNRALSNHAQSLNLQAA